MRRDYIGKIREFNTRHFRVVIEAHADNEMDLSHDENADETIEKLERGEWVAFQVAARVILKDTGQELGTDHLGGCIYETIEAFADHRKCGKQNRKWERQGKRGRCGSYFSDMIGQAIAEARQNLARTKAALHTIRLRQVPR